jgi:hypothetical protein
VSFSSILSRVRSGGTTWDKQRKTWLQLLQKTCCNFSSCSALFFFSSFFPFKLFFYKIFLGVWFVWFFCFNFYYVKFGEEGLGFLRLCLSFFQGQDMLLPDPCRCCNQKVAAPEANPHMLRMSTRALCSIFMYLPQVTYILFLFLFIYLFK